MLDLNQPVQTRDGMPARIICTNFNTNASSKQPVIAVVGPPGREVCHTYSLEGLFVSNLTRPNEICHLDLVNCPPPNVERFLNIYDDDVPGDLEDSLLESARERRYAGSKRDDRIAVLKLTFSADRKSLLSVEQI